MNAQESVNHNSANAAIRTLKALGHIPTRKQLRKTVESVCALKVINVRAKENENRYLQGEYDVVVRIVESRVVHTIKIGKLTHA